MRQTGFFLDTFSPAFPLKESSPADTTARLNQEKSGDDFIKALVDLVVLETRHPTEAASAWDAKTLGHPDSGGPESSSQPSKRESSRPVEAGLAARGRSHDLPLRFFF
jgi:hypothetical protein